MKFAATVALLAGVAAAGEYAYPPHGNDTYVTKVLTAYTTYCPGPTSITHGGKTYTVTEATTLTITDCPCTVTYPAITSTYSACNTCPPPPPPYVPKPTGGYTPPGNGTVPQPTGPAPSNPAPGNPGVSPFPGAASKVVGASGAGLAALFGLIAFAL